jgi:hypothetical protein
VTSASADEWAKQRETYHTAIEGFDYQQLRCVLQGVLHEPQEQALQEACNGDLHTKGLWDQRPQLEVHLRCQGQVGHVNDHDSRARSACDAYQS